MIDLSKMSDANKATKLAKAASKAKKAKERASIAEVTPIERANRIRDEQGGLVPTRMIDLYGDPAVSFDPSDKRRRIWVEALNGSRKSAQYKVLIRKLGSAFSRIYERYRREAERRLNGQAKYHIFDTERKKCELIGALCILKGITPAKLISYWDANIRHFADGHILIPPLAFLASPSNVDAAVVSSQDRSSHKSGPRASSGPITKVSRRNTFADIEGLDRRLRLGLERGGFSTQNYNDRYLLTIQHNAIELAKGTDILIPNGKLRRMCEWAAKNLYFVQEEKTA